MPSRVSRTRTPHLSISQNWQFKTQRGPLSFLLGTIAKYVFGSWEPPGIASPGYFFSTNLPNMGIFAPEATVAPGSAATAAIRFDFGAR